MEKSEVLLVSMPWALVSHPSIQLGILHSVLEKEGWLVSSYSAYVDHCSCLIQDGAIPDYRAYEQWAGDQDISESVFWEPSFCDISQKDSNYVMKTYGRSKYLEFLSLRDSTHKFIETTCNKILSNAPKLIGFSITFNQLISSLSISKLIKAHKPDIKIVFGGAVCEGSVGEEILAKYPWVDMVIHGEAEGIISDVFRELLENGELTKTWCGISHRKRDGSIILGGKNRNSVDICLADYPNYDEYFDRLNSTQLSNMMRTETAIPFEASRGCWWGAKHQCKFCGLNSEQTYRSKPWRQTLDELSFLSEKYVHNKFFCVDNILDYRYLGDFLDHIINWNTDFETFFEIKSNLSINNLIKLKKAGVTSIQPGIESLSTEILRLINKGVSAIQNVRILKIAEWLDFKYVGWNLMYGFPGEPPGEYDRMADICSMLSHFQPPQMAKLVIANNSPYHQNLADYGIQVKNLENPFLTLFPEYSYADNRNPGIYTKKLKRQIKKWNESYKGKNRSSLVYYKIGDKTIIVDKRLGQKPSTRCLDSIQSAIYHKCFDITTRSKLILTLQNESSNLSSNIIAQACDDLEKNKLIYREGEQIIGLAIPYWKHSYTS